MSIFTEIERLIDERGSSTILKDRILLLKEKHAVFVSENIAHKTKIAELGTQVRQLKNEITKLQEINEKLKFDIIQLTEKIDSFHNSGITDHVCDHCGSRRLKRTGNRPNKRFGKLGVKDTLFQCEDCGKETAVMIVASR
jgi:ribosomal protein L37AE/L43A